MRDLIPETFKLGRNVWRTEFLTRDEMNEFIPGSRQAIIGFCDGEDRVIYLAEHLKGRRLAQTFVHELIHGVCFDFNVKVPHWLVYKLDRHLGNFLWDNFLKRNAGRRKVGQ